MTTRTHIVDSGGTTRLVQRWGLVDSGGTTRMAKRVFVVDSGGVSRLIFTSGPPGTVDLSFMASAVYQDTGTPSALIEVTFFADGTVYQTGTYSTGGSPVYVGDWLTAGSNDGAFEIQFAFNSGTIPGGSSVDTWLPLNTDRTIYLGDDASCNLTALIRYDGGSTLTSASFDLVAAPF